MKFKVLDNGFVRFVDKMGDDSSIADAARVSYSSVKKRSDDRGLIRYLMNHSHTTPFEMIETKWHLRMPIHVARQWMRHRTACLSGDTLLFFDEPSAIKKQVRKRSKETIKSLYNKWNNGAIPIITKYGTKISIPMKDRIKNRNIRCYNETTRELTHTNIVDIYESGIKDVYQITLDNNYTIKTTLDHLYFTDKGWFRLEDLAEIKINVDKTVKTFKNIYKIACNGMPVYQDYTWMSNQRKQGYSVSQIAQMAGCSYHTIRSWLKKHDLRFSYKEKSKLSGLSQRGQKRPNLKRKPLSAKAIQNIKLARSGEKSNFWKGGVSTDRQNIGRWTRDQSKNIHKQNNYQCIICKSHKKLVTHHIDPVFNNLEKAYDVTNLTTLCDICHKIIHGQNLEFKFLEWYNKDRVQNIIFNINNYSKELTSKYQNRKTTKLTVSYYNIKNIVYVGQEMTYDIEVKDHHNFVANGIIVHNSINELSGRYSPLPEDFYSEYSLKAQSKKNNQGRTDEDIDDSELLMNDIIEHQKESFRLYKDCLNSNVAKEIARMHLPFNTYTEFYWKIDLHNLFHFLKLRTDSHAQFEIRQYAHIIACVIKKIFPVAFEAWYDYSYCARKFSRLDLKMLSYIDKSFELGLDLSDEKIYAYAQEIGMSKRELEELWLKRTPEENNFDISELHEIN